MELDEQLFRDEAFDAYAWLEEAVIDRGGRVPELAALVPQLALLSQSLTASIHGTLHQLTLAGPQLQAQLDAMQRATAPLAQQLDSVVAGAGAGRSSATAPRKKDEEEQDLQHLLELHEAKQRLQSCSKALVEAARWEKNVRACAASIDGIAPPDASDAKAATATTLADRVHEMHDSLEILKDMPGADDRKRTMERLSAQIEASMKPKLDEYLQATQLPVAQVQFCRAVLASIGRADHVVQAYCRCRPAQIHRLWYSYSASDSGPFAAWLDSTFYREVLRMVQRESDHAAEIFGVTDAPRVLVALIENTLATLKESFRDRLKKDFTVDQLLRAYQASCAFVGQVAKAIRVSSNTPSTIVEASDLIDDIVDSGPLDHDVAERVLMAALAPYQTFFTNYAQLAGDALARQLTSLVPRFSAPADQDLKREEEEDDDFGSAAVDENVLEAYALRVEDVSNELWTAVEDSVRVCYEFSAGAAFPDAVRVVAHAVEQLTQRLSAAMPAIRQAIGVEATKQRSSSSMAEPHGMLVTDWGKFHSTLALLRACGTLESDLATVEARLSVRMREQVQRLFNSSAKGDDAVPSHKTSPQAKRKEFMRRRSGSNVLSLSALATEPSRIATSAVMKWLKDEPEREKALSEFVQDLVVSEDDRDAKVFVQAHTSLTRYTRQVQTLVYDSVFAPIAQVLRNVPVNECWIKTPDASLGDLPTFSTLPQEYITLVADLLLSLLPQLEPFAESSSLQKAAAASIDAHKVCAREWATLGQLLRLSPSEIDVCERIFEISPSEDGDTSDANAGSDAATFVDIWTSAVASGTTAALLTAVTKIPSLSPLGAKQLEADVGYFRNVLNALSGGGSDRNFLIVGLQTALQVPDAEYASFVEQLRSRDSVPKTQDGEGDDSDDNIARASAHVVLHLHETLLAKRQLHHHSPPTTASTHHETVSSSQYY